MIPVVALPERTRWERAVVRWMLVVGVVALSFAIASTAASGSHETLVRSPAQPEPTATDGTPVVDPEPQPVPLYLPYLGDGDDKTQPPPLAPVFRGHVAALTASGREACAPAKHILLREPEGTPANTAIAALVQGLPDPQLTLDLYIGEYVELKGTQEIAPRDCRQVTPWLVRVRDIRIIRLPPGR
jgi:hypothetical protein